MTHSGFGLGVDVADVCSYSGCTGDIVQRQLADIRRDLQQQPERLPNASCCSEKRYFPVGVSVAGEGATSILECDLRAAAQCVQHDARYDGEGGFGERTATTHRRVFSRLAQPFSSSSSCGLNVARNPFDQLQRLRKH